MKNPMKKRQQVLNFDGDREMLTPQHYSDFAESMKLSDGELYLQRNALADADAARLVHHLSSKIAWRHEIYRGQPARRGTAWFADECIEYRYSGQAMTGSGWDATLSEFCGIVNRICGVSFNSLLINYYPDGRAQMGWHADDEPELGLNPVIASLSFGVSRTFRLRHKTQPEACGCVLDDNCLLVMAGTLQHYWQHAVPRQTIRMGERFNLTFRHVIPDYWKFE